MSVRLLWLGLLHISLSALWKVADAQAAFTIDQVTLTVFPGNDVASGTNVILRCEAKVSHSHPQPLTYTFSFLLDDQVTYSKNISDSVVERGLSPARVSNSGHYQCTVRVFDKIKTSNSQALKVTGLQVPMLKVKNDIVSEGDNIIATCSAPEETGSMFFFFYEGNQEVKRVKSAFNTVTTTLAMQKPKNICLHCNYMVLMHPTAGISNKSNAVNVTVQGLEITPQISISPKVNFVEGDRVQISCKAQNHSDLELFLTKGNTVLHKLHTTFMHSLTVRAEDSGEYVCKAEKGSVQKTAIYRLNVTELFSKPILRMSPGQVFEGEQFTLTCSSAVSSQEKIKKVDIKYALWKEDRHISSGANYSATASPATNGKYSCMAVAKGVNKTSQPLHSKAKVPVSYPVIRAVEKVIVGRPFKVLCEAENGTLPITYTLLKDHVPVDEKRAEAAQKALFSINSISHPDEIYRFTCQAHNQGPSIRKSSQFLRADVIVPVSKPVLVPQDFTITEGLDLTLICTVQKGTFPITYTWYHKSDMIPFSTQEVRSLEGRYTVKAIERDQRGDYYCEASNYDTEIKRSFSARIGVSLAVWKKALIGMFCILLLVAIAIVLTVFLKKMSKPRIKKQATELSVKPSRPKSGDPMRMSLTLDIEDNTALNGTPCVMGRNVWSEHVSGSDSDDHTDEDSRLVQPQEVDLSREVPVKKSIEPEYSGQHTEVQVSTPGVSEQAEGAALEYAQLNNSEQEPA
ncbi:platelet endothelial cell adhesion molecule isoform X2 [Megalobrama amblycephala]|uniref:platelet endothelial cell adhesion molecule isoform X2 n=1 Tax=Megalobrama amblycephala TaxID=75352 RepID=UPI002013D8BA|nr:platelet endothelial cell adhesion molecule isoform X2 [Megalobrama amblycephala]